MKCLHISSQLFCLIKVGEDVILVLILIIGFIVVDHIINDCGTASVRAVNHIAASHIRPAVTAIRHVAVGDVHSPVARIRCISIFPVHIPIAVICFVAVDIDDPACR